MKTINVVSLVAVGSISALLLCWSRHSPGESVATPTESSSMTFADAVVGDSTAMWYDMCCQSAASSQAEICPVNLKDDPSESLEIAGCTAKD